MSGKYYVVELTPCNDDDYYYKKTLYFRTKNDAREVCNFIEGVGDEDPSASASFCSKYDREMFDILYDRYAIYKGYDTVLKTEYIDKNYEPSLAVSD